MHPDGPEDGAPDIPILARTEHWVAVAKPVDLMVHPSKLSQDRAFLVPILKARLGENLYPVHRLDRATSGVLLLARNKAAAAELGKAFQQRRVAKSYLAVVRGWMDDSGWIDRPLTTRGGDTEVPALTRYRCLGRVELPFAVGRYPTSRYSLIMARPHTGRTHQIRRHLKHCFHPIVGDTTYGEGRHNRFFRTHYGIHRMLLHALSLVVRPADTIIPPFRVRAGLPGDFQKLIEAWGWADARAG